MTNKEKAKLLRSAASALEHGRNATARKKLQQALGGPVVVFVEGGVVQDVGRVLAGDSSAKSIAGKRQQRATPSRQAVA